MSTLENLRWGGGGNEMWRRESRILCTFVPIASRKPAIAMAPPNATVPTSERMCLMVSWMVSVGTTSPPCSTRAESVSTPTTMTDPTRHSRVVEK